MHTTKRHMVYIVIHILWVERSWSLWLLAGVVSLPVRSFEERPNSSRDDPCFCEGQCCDWKPGVLICTDHRLAWLRTGHICRERGSPYTYAVSGVLKSRRPPRLLCVRSGSRDIATWHGLCSYRISSNNSNLALIHPRTKVAWSVASCSIGNWVWRLEHVFSEMPTFCSLRPRNPDSSQSKSQDLSIYDLRNHSAKWACRLRLVTKPPAAQDQRTHCSLNERIRPIGEISTKSLAICCEAHNFV